MDWRVANDAAVWGHRLEVRTGHHRIKERKPTLVNRMRGLHSSDDRSAQANRQVQTQLEKKANGVLRRRDQNGEHSLGTDRDSVYKLENYPTTGSPSGLSISPLIWRIFIRKISYKNQKPHQHFNSRK